MLNVTAEEKRLHLLSRYGKVENVENLIDCFMWGDRCCRLRLYPVGTDPWNLIWLRPA